MASFQIGGYEGIDAALTEFRAQSSGRVGSTLDTIISQPAQRRDLIDFINAQNTTNERVALALAIVANESSTPVAKQNALDQVLDGLRQQAKVSAKLMNNLFALVPTDGANHDG